MSGNTSTGGNIGGLSADTWSNLGNFLSQIGVAANQRTGGGFLANPTLGAALSQAGVSNQAYQQQLQESRARQVALGAQTQSQQMQNQLMGWQMPYYHQMIDQYYGGGGAMGNAPSMPMSQAGAPLPSTPGGGSIPMENRQPLLDWATQMPGVTVPASILGGTIQRESGWDPTAKNPQSGAFGLGQTLESTAQNPGPGMPGTTMEDLQRPENQAYFTARYLSLRGKEVGLNTAADWEDPKNAPKVMAALNGYGGQKQQGPTQYAADILQYASQYGGAQRTVVTPASDTPPAAGKPYLMPDGSPVLGPDNKPVMGNGTPISLPANQSGPRIAPAISPPVLGGGVSSPAPQQMPANDGGIASTGLPQIGTLWGQAQQAQRMADMYSHMPMMPGAAQEAQFWQQRAHDLMGFAMQRSEGRPGTVQYDVNGNPLGATPVMTETYDKQGVPHRDFLSPLTGQPIGGGGAGNASGAIENAPLAGVGPRQEKLFETAGGIPAEQIKKDNAMVDEEWEHVIGSVLPVQKSLLQMRDQIAGADTGALGQFRASMKNYIQTFAPSVAATIGADATPAQIFNKLALMQSGQQERGDLGSRGGYRAIQMYADANPKLDMQPDANRHMVNALMIMQQANADYAQGVNDYFNRQSQAWQQNPTGAPYNSVKNYDAAYASTFTPQMYVSAINAMNGAGDWKKGLTPKQMQLVAGIVQRTDPTANIIVDGKPLPVSSITKTVSPMQIAGQ